MRATIDGICGEARATTVITQRGRLRTPLFMPVGTRGAVRTLDTEDLERLGPQIVLGNT
ncbi:MAG: tRNA guanosine(34) transglycosylase Tgt, partial [Acidimicrobiales bacterium]